MSWYWLYPVEDYELKNASVVVNSHLVMMEDAARDGETLAHIWSWLGEKDPTVTA